MTNNIPFLTSTGILCLELAPAKCTLTFMWLWPTITTVSGHDGIRLQSIEGTRDILSYYTDTSVLLENTPLVKFIRNHIRNSSSVFSISSLVMISVLSLMSSLSLKLYLNSLVLCFSSQVGSFPSSRQGIRCKTQRRELFFSSEQSECIVSLESRRIHL